MLDEPEPKKSTKGFATFLGRRWEKRSVEAPALQTLKTANVSQRFTPDEAAAMAEAHSPECFLACCVDSRFQPAKALDYGPGMALEYRIISCAIPPAYKADPDLKSKMAFRRLKNIETIILVCHSDCGGAQAALTCPQPDAESEDDLHAVASFVQRTGLDLSVHSKAFLAAEKGDVRKAGDRLAREIGAKSLHNLMTYKGREGYATVGDEVKAGALNIMLLYYDLENRSFDMYDAERAEWKHTEACDFIGLRQREALHSCAENSRRAAVSLRKKYDGG